MAPPVGPRVTPLTQKQQVPTGEKDMQAPTDGDEGERLGCYGGKLNDASICPGCNIPMETKC